MSATPLFAFGFGALSMLGGLALASAPIIIHLLSRRKYREMQWAAMKWLLAAIQKHARRIRIEQLILLAVRTLLVLCVVLAMAKPFLEGAGAALVPGKRVQRVIVIDHSLSMGYRATDRMRFERAKDVAAAILKDSRPGDAASLILMGAPPRVVIGDPSSNLAAVAAEIQSLELTHGGADLAATLAKIDDVLAASSLDQKEVYFISDLQRASWVGANDTLPPSSSRASSGPRDKPAAGAAMQELAAKITGRANVAIIDLGAGAADNIAVVSFTADDPFVTVGRESRFTATLRNFGRSARPGLAVTLSVDGAVQDRRTVDLPAGEQASLVLTQAFENPGRRLVELHLEDDALAIDNHRWLALDVKEAINVLLVDGDPSPQRFAGETDYLSVALAPETTAGTGTSVFRPEVVRESEFADLDLARFDCLVFANVGQFSDAEVRQIETHLRRGGGAVWFLGRLVNVDSYNRVLFREGKGIFPAQLGSRAGDAKSRESFFLFDPHGYAHPIIEPFRGAESGGLVTTKTFEYVRAELPAESTASVALGYNGGDPAIITAAAHRGRVAVVTTSADIEWTNWPYWPSYVPVMNELVSFVVADRDRDRTTTVGQSLASAVPASALEVPVTVELPSRETVPRRMPPRDEPGYFLFDQTPLSGGYRLNFGPPLATADLFAVNVDPRESDLAKLEADELRERLPGLKFQYLTNWQAIAAGKSGVTANRGELHRHLLYAALALVFLESLLAWRFGHYET